MSVDDKFIEEHAPLVRGIATKLAKQLDLKVDRDDLIAFGYRGLLEARARYDASRGVQFNTFAYYRIRGAIVDGVREMAYLPRRAHALLRAAEAMDSVLEPSGEAHAASLGQPGATSAEVAAQRIDDALHKVTAAFVMSVVGQGHDDAPETPEEMFMQASERASVSDAVSQLPERERALVQGFYFEGRTFDDVAKGLGISKSWASRLHAKALDLLREALDRT